MATTTKPIAQKLTERQQQQRVVKWAQEHENKFSEPTAQSKPDMCARYSKALQAYLTGA